MSMRIGKYTTNQMPVQNQMAAANQKKAGNYGASAKKTGYDESILKMKQMLRSGNGQANSMQNPWGQKSVVQESLGYTDSLRASREKAKMTSLEKKKLQYNYKSVSSRILNSKTSASARQAVNQARREVVKLEKKRGSDDYDQEELEAAISHAKAIERLAKKKVRHLEEEEMAKVTGGVCAGEVEEKEELRGEEPEEEEKLDESLEDEAFDPEKSEDDYAFEEAYPEEINPEDFSDAAIDSMSMEEMEAFLDDMQQTMKDVLEESGLSDLFEELNASPGEEMDPADYKMMKIKHRCKEMKDLVKADADYLKVIFKKMEESKGKAIDGLRGMGSSGGMGMLSGSPSGAELHATVHIDVPVSDMGEAPSGGNMPSIDVSI